MPKLETLCAYCGKVLYLYPSHMRRSDHHFCSHSCSTKWRNENDPPLSTRVPRICQWCDKEFMVFPSELGKHACNYCSKVCEAKARRKDRTANTICAHCGKPIFIEPYALKERNYCSRECHNEARRVYTTCTGCGIPIVRMLSETSKYKKLYCSKDCRLKGARVEHPCDNCGRIMSLKRSVAERKGQQTLCCSRECSGELKNKIAGRPAPDKVRCVCEHCATEFWRWPSQFGDKYPNRYCSKECFDKSRQAEVSCARCGKIFLVPRSQESCRTHCSYECAYPKNIKTCWTCKREFHVKPSQELGQHTRGKFCSRKCRAIYYDPHNLDKEWLTIEQVAILVQVDPATIRHHCQLGHLSFDGGLGHIVVSKTEAERFRIWYKEWRVRPRTDIELAIDGALEDAGIAFEPEYPFGRFTIDQAIVDAKIAIECDELYWHSFPEDITSNLEKDRLLIEAGWLVLRFRGDEIRRDAKRLVRERVLPLLKSRRATQLVLPGLQSVHLYKDYDTSR